MPRAIWSGAISFGLVSIPVKLFGATSRKSVRFNQLDGRTNARVKQKRVSALDGSEVPYDEIVKGYEIGKDQYIVVTDDELASLAPRASRTIDITDFVDESEIDPIFYDAAYYLVPDELGRKPYALLMKAMEERGQVAMASFVMRTKQYLCALRPGHGVLSLSTMIYADEVVDPEMIDGLDLSDIEVSDAEIAMASTLIDNLTGHFEPEKYQDNYRLEMLALLERKEAGEEPVVASAAGGTNSEVVDLLAALEASVAAAKQARTRHPAGTSVDGVATEVAGDDEAPAARSA